MKRYYNKVQCRVAGIVSFKRVNAEGFSGEFEIVCDDGQTYKVAQPEGGAIAMLRFKQDTLEYLGGRESRPVNELVVPKIQLHLVERYDFSSDELRYNVVEDEIFHKNFFEDESPELIEMHGFEEPYCLEKH